MIIMFLDDGLGRDSNFEKCIESSQIVKFKLENLGFLIAHEKCFWLPSQRLKWLGYTWDTNIGKIFVNEDRIMKTEKKIRFLIDETNVGVEFFGSRFLASIVGQLISMQIVIGDLVRLNTRCLYDCIMGRASWDGPVKICKKAINEIHFWSISLQKLNDAGVDICKIDQLDIVDIEMFCDASDVGFGGYLTSDLNAKLVCKEMSGNWTLRERNESSTWRELECVNRFVQTFDNTFSDKTVKIYTDNQNVPHILRVGSKKQKLQDIATAIKQTCVDSNINIITQWVPRENNTHADKLSRHTDHDDWAIHSDIFDENQ
ncbi:Hypothetical predicted protein [Mytilus galloprovincialis]|uniref:Reverse transcriptase RNase H-like domain-containing protein n=1 Tax=Mytilus galloprovincialis TaxID=29158 RepID=A0A8B6G5I6_MYTGA|nr:Hypothetical predicted protein [Mytilus galloprovincialis]